MARSGIGWFFAFLALNLVALYLPGLIWVSFAPGPAGFGLKWLISPVILPVLVLNPKSLAAWLAILAPYAIVIPGLSGIAFCRYRWLACVGPCVLFAISLGQGVLFLLLMHMDWLGEC
jgi:hypothetical protein